MTNGQRLRRHVRFFDLNDDGKVTVVETFKGLRSLKLDLLISSIGAVALHLALGKKSGGSLFSISIDGLQKVAHPPDDTGTFSQPEAITLSQPYYTLADIKELIKKRGGNPNTFMFLIEWTLLFQTLRKFRSYKTPEGVDAITKEEMEGLMDGSLFFKLTGRKVPDF